MKRAEISGWENIKRLLIEELERRVGAEVKDYWIDTIRLEPHESGDLWIARLRAVARKGVSRRGYLVSAEIDAITGDVKRFEARPAR